MFKKRNLKGSNFAADIGTMGATAASGPTKEADDDDTGEPLLQKKVKTTTGAKYSTKEQTEEYERLMTEYTDELKFKSRAELLTKDKGNAVASREIDTDESHDARAIKLKQLQLSKDIKAGKVDKSSYRGEAGYAVYAEKSEKDIANSKYTGTLGPIRAPSNVRATVRFDYNPSLCKDWHDTGYCGFGDSCIYIHDRGDYKSGWELEKEWEKEQADKSKRFSVTTSGEHFHGDSDQGEEEEDDGIPRKCQLCEQEFKSPVVTTCKHYFCEKCAFDHYRQNKTCPVCSKPMNGIFNIAHDVIAREKTEGGGSRKQDKKEGRIVLNQQDESDKIATRKKQAREGGEEGLEGVEFGDDGEDEEDKGEEGEETHEHHHPHHHHHGKRKDKKGEEEEEVDLEKLAQEFKAENQKQKKFRIDSDWLY